MSWGRRWPERQDRPEVAKLSPAALEKLHAKATSFVSESFLLRELVQRVQLARGRLYFWRGPEDLMARITPLGPRSLLLESKRNSSWTEHRRGQLATVLKTLEGDTDGTLHGLGVLLADHDANLPAQVFLYRQIGIPIRVLAEPGYWYSMHRRPSIVEISDAKDHALVQFSPFDGRCLYTLRDGEWGCYTIRPNASESIQTALAWLEKRGWKDWG